MLKFTLAFLLMILSIYCPSYGMQENSCAAPAFDIPSLAHMSLGNLNLLVSLLYGQTFLCESIAGAVFPSKNFQTRGRLGRLANDIQTVVDGVKAKVKRDLRESPQDGAEEELSVDTKNKHRQIIALFYTLDLVAQKGLNQQMISDFDAFDTIPREFKPLFYLTEQLSIFLQKIDNCLSGDIENELCAQIMPGIERVCDVYEKTSLNAYSLYACIINVLRSPEKHAKPHHMSDRYFSRRLPLNLSNDATDQINPRPVQSKGLCKREIDKRSMDGLVERIAGKPQQQIVTPVPFSRPRRKNKKINKKSETLLKTIPVCTENPTIIPILTHYQVGMACATCTSEPVDFDQPD